MLLIIKKQIEPICICQLNNHRSLSPTHQTDGKKLFLTCQPFSFLLFSNISLCDCKTECKYCQIKKSVMALLL